MARIHGPQSALLTTASPCHSVIIPLTLQWPYELRGHLWVPDKLPGGQAITEPISGTTVPVAATQAACDFTPAVTDAAAAASNCSMMFTALSTMLI